VQATPAYHSGHTARRSDTGMGRGQRRTPARLGPSRSLARPGPRRGVASRCPRAGGRARDRDRLWQPYRAGAQRPGEAAAREARVRERRRSVACLISSAWFGADGPEPQTPAL